MKLSWQNKIKVKDNDYNETYEMNAEAGRHVAAYGNEF